MNDKYNILLDNMFSADFNANDFFFYGTAQSISIAREDFPWVLGHVEKWGQDGLNACLAYIQNLEPIAKYKTDKFDKAIDELIKREQVVFGDIDYKFYFYSEGNTYRTIKQHNI